MNETTKLRKTADDQKLEYSYNFRYKEINVNLQLLFKNIIFLYPSSNNESYDD